MIKESYPLQWPAGQPRNKNPKRSRFGNKNRPTIAYGADKIADELRLLKNLRRINSNDFIISTNLKYKNDGMPYSNQKRPEDQGAAVYFEWDGKQMVIACDTYDEIGCNLYAIGKTIEAMRDIQRWGSSDLLNRAFTGFQALPEKASQSTWYTVLGLEESATEEEIRDRYRALVKQLHPDVPGGSHDKFIEVKNAYDQAMSLMVH